MPRMDGSHPQAVDPVVGRSVSARGVRRGRLAEIARGVETELFAPKRRTIDQYIADTGWAVEAAGRSCRRCGHTVGPFEAGASGCPACRGAVLAYDAVVRLGPYGPPLDGWVRESKFRRLSRNAERLGTLLADTALERGAIVGSDRGNAGPVVVPIPTPRLRRLSRGIDHTRVLAAAFARRAGLRVMRALWAREHEPQHRLAGPERKRNLALVYRLRRGVADRLAGRPVVLIDDVVTTGSTARAAALALSGRPDLRYSRGERSPSRIVLAVVAVAGEPERRAVDERVTAR